MITTEDFASNWCFLPPSYVEHYLNIPPVHGDTLKAREREIGPAIEDIANTSCERMLEEEKKQWGSTERVNETVPIGASYDMGWQKRGKGHNSLTGT